MLKHMLKPLHKPRSIKNREVHFFHVEQIPESYLMALKKPFLSKTIQDNSSWKPKYLFHVEHSMLETRKQKVRLLNLHCFHVEHFPRYRRHANPEEKPRTKSSQHHQKDKKRQTVNESKSNRKIRIKINKKTEQ